jgi:hypothetical protein
MELSLSHRIAVSTLQPFSYPRIEMCTPYLIAITSKRADDARQLGINPISTFSLSVATCLVQSSPQT